MIIIIIIFNQPSRHSSIIFNNLYIINSNVANLRKRKWPSRLSIVPDSAWWWWEINNMVVCPSFSVPPRRTHTIFLQPHGACDRFMCVYNLPPTTAGKLSCFSQPYSLILLTTSSLIFMSIFLFIYTSLYPSITLLNFYITIYMINSKHIKAYSFVL